jgi:dipeptidyl aminopeptidase/acylaminoacyl peptidase
MRAVVLAVVVALGLVVPRQAHAEPPPLDAFAQLPTIEKVTLSPSGQRLALVVRESAGGKLYVRQVDGPLLMAAPIKDATVERLGWAGDDIVLGRVSNLAAKGPVFAYVAGEFAVDMAKLNVTPIYNRFGPVPQVIGFYGARLVGARWYGYYGGWEGLFSVDLQTGAHSMVAPSDPGAQWAVDETGKAIAKLTYNAPRARGSLTSTTSGRVVADIDAGFDCVCLWGLGRIADTALIRLRGEDGYYTVAEEPLAAVGPARPISHGHEVTETWADPQTGLLIGYSWSDDAVHYVFYDPLTQKRVDAALAAFKGYRASLTSASRDFARIVAYTDGGDDSGTYWLVDIASGKASILGSAYPHVPPAETGPVSVFRYKAADGLPLEAVLTLPPGREARRLPLIVLVHGGPEQHVVPGFRWLAQAFASRGYAVLEPNFRGSAGYGKAFRDAGFGEWGRKMQTDLSDGADALAAAGVVDPKRVCIMGSEYGGYAAVAGVTLQHGHYRCAVSYGGIYDMREVLAARLQDEGRLSPKYWGSFIGAAKADTSLERISPVTFASEADAPILLVEPRRESFLIQQAPSMERALQRSGKPVDLVNIDSDDWTLGTAQTRIALLNAAVPFLEKYNPSDAH